LSHGIQAAILLVALAVVVHLSVPTADAWARPKLSSDSWLPPESSPLPKVALEDRPRFSNPLGKVGLVVDPNRPRAYVTGYDSVIVYSTLTSEIEAQIPVRANPVALAINPAATTLYVGHAGNRSILAINLSTLSVTRVLPTAFLVWDLVAPTNETLVATAHEENWVDQQPYILNSTDGTVLGRLCDPSWCIVFENSLATVSADRNWLFLVEPAQPNYFSRFSKGPEPWNWTFVSKKGDHGVTGTNAQDAVVSPDTQYLYVATNGDGLLQFDATNFTITRRYGTATDFSAVALSPSGNHVLGCAFDAALHVFDSNGQALVDYPLPWPVAVARPLPGGYRYAASAGSVLIIVGGTTLTPTNPYPIFADSHPTLEATLATNLSVADLSFEMDLDGAPIAATLDESQMMLRGVPNGPLPDGNYSVVAVASRQGTVVASASWTFAVDTTPPRIAFEPLPAVVHDSAITVRGTVEDAHLWNVTVAGQPVAFTYWMGTVAQFQAVVGLWPGNNSIPMIASDVAGNRASINIAIAFEPLFESFSADLGHFRILAPIGWQTKEAGEPREGGASLLMPGGTRDGTANVLISWQSAVLWGTYSEARSLLEQDLRARSLDNSPYGHSIVETSYDGHPAALATFSFPPSPYAGYLALAVVVDGDWGLYWSLQGSAVGNATSYGTVVSESMASIDILQAPPPSLYYRFAQAHDVLLAIGLAATALEGTVMLSLVLRQRRQARKAA